MALLGLSGVPAFAAERAPLPARARGAARVDARAHGARGDGKQDDTQALQSAIDALPDAGGTVAVPAGDYLIDPVRSIRLRDRMLLELAPGARLVAKPNAAARAYVLTVQGVSDVEIAGGAIVGERDAHMGGSGEWGHGVMVRGASRVTIRGLRASRCWGDGISIGGDKAGGGAIVPSDDIVVANVVCQGNRRQGLTIGRSRKVRVYDSEFSGTGGTLPGCGIDVEPDAGDYARDVVIDRCVVRGNQGSGIQLYKRASGITISRCTIEDNRGYGVLTVAAEGCVIENNQIRRNGLRGIGLRPGTRDVAVTANEFADNGAQPARGARPASANPRARHIGVAAGTQAIRISADNRYD